MDKEKLEQPSRIKGIYLLIVFLIFGICVGGILLYDYVSTNLWLLEHDDWAKSYPYLLIEKGKDKPISLQSDDEVELMRIVREESKHDRIVTLLTCSEVKYNLFKTKGYVKALLETATPTEPPRHSRLVQLFIFKRHKERWALDRIENLAIE